MSVLLYPGPPGTQGAVAGVVCPPKSATEGRVFRSASQALVDPQRGIRKSHRSFFNLLPAGVPLIFFLSCLVVVFVASRGRKECSRWRDSGRGSDQNQRKHQQSAAA